MSATVRRGRSRFGFFAGALGAACGAGFFTGAGGAAATFVAALAAGRAWVFCAADFFPVAFFTGRAVALPLAWALVFALTLAGAALRTARRAGAAFFFAFLAFFAAEEV